MRRLVFLCALAVIASAVVAYSLPRGAHNLSASPVAGQPGPSALAANAPVVISAGIQARSLAVATSAPTGDTSGDTTLFLTTADHPNQLLALTLPAALSRLSTLADVAKLPLIAGEGAPGSFGDGGAAIAAQLSLKSDSLLMRSGVAVAADGTVFISDTRNATIRVIAGPASTEPGVIRSLVGRWAPRQNIELVEPMGIALDRAGNLYIADHGANDVLVMRAAASQTPGLVEILTHVTQPASISSAPDGSKIYVASPEYGAVFMIDTRTRAIQSLAALAGKASSCPGAQVSREAPSATCPTGVAVDGRGNVFIADAAANHILRVDAKSEVATVAATQLSTPGEINFDANGNLFVADQGHDRLVEFRALGQAANTVTLSPASNDFGVEPTGGTSPPASFTLTNNTNAALTNLVVNSYEGADPGDFQTLSSSCTSTLAANSSCTINVAFVPIVVMSRSAQLAVTYAGAPALTADLTGIGADYQLGLAGSQNMSVTAVAGTSATYKLQLMPDSNFPVNSPYTVTFVSPPIASPTSTQPPGDLPALTTATFMPTSMTVTPGTVIPFTLTIETTSRITGLLGSVPASLDAKPPNPQPPPLFPALALIVAVAIYLGSRAVALKSAKRLRVGSIAFLFLAAAGMIGGCGGGKGRGTIGTPAGTTNFQVQATVQNAQGASLNVSRGFILQLVVQ